MTHDATTSTASTASTPTRSDRLRHRLRRGAQIFTAVRRTRPFWGACWLALGGVWTLLMLGVSTGFLVVGMTRSVGYPIAMSLVLFAVVVLIWPQYSGFAGFLAIFASLGAFVYANLGGFLVGSVLGVLGGSMIMSWGDKTPGRRGVWARRRGRQPVASIGPVVDHAVAGEPVDGPGDGPGDDQREGSAHRPTDAGTHEGDA